MEDEGTTIEPLVKESQTDPSTSNDIDSLTESIQCPDYPSGDGSESLIGALWFLNSELTCSDSRELSLDSFVNDSVRSLFHDCYCRDANQALTDAISIKDGNQPPTSADECVDPFDGALPDSRIFEETSSTTVAERDVKKLCPKLLEIRIARCTVETSPKAKQTRETPRKRQGRHIKKIPRKKRNVSSGSKSPKGGFNPSCPIIPSMKSNSIRNSMKLAVDIAIFRAMNDIDSSESSSPAEKLASSREGNDSDEKKGFAEETKIEEEEIREVVVTRRNRRLPKKVPETREVQNEKQITPKCKNSERVNETRQSIAPEVAAKTAFLDWCPTSDVEKVESHSWDTAGSLPVNTRNDFGSEQPKMTLSVSINCVGFSSSEDHRQNPTYDEAGTSSGSHSDEQTYLETSVPLENEQCRLTILNKGRSWKVSFYENLSSTHAEPTNLTCPDCDEVRVALRWSEIHFSREKFDKAIRILLDNHLVVSDPTLWLLKGSPSDFELIKQTVAKFLGKLSQLKINDSACALATGVITAQNSVSEPIDVSQFLESLIASTFRADGTFRTACYSLYLAARQRGFIFNDYVPCRMLVVQTAMMSDYPRDVMKDLIDSCIKLSVYSPMNARNIVIQRHMVEEEIRAYLREWAIRFENGDSTLFDQLPPNILIQDSDSKIAGSRYASSELDAIDSSNQSVVNRVARAIAALSNRA